MQYILFKHSGGEYICTKDSIEKSKSGEDKDPNESQDSVEKSEPIKKVDEESNSYKRKDQKFVPRENGIKESRLRDSSRNRKSDSDRDHDKPKRSLSSYVLQLPDPGIITRTVDPQDSKEVRDVQLGKGALQTPEPGAHSSPVHVGNAQTQ